MKGDRFQIGHGAKCLGKTTLDSIIEMEMKRLEVLQPLDFMWNSNASESIVG
jgi:hypothetical protein